MLSDFCNVGYGDPAARGLPTIGAARLDVLETRLGRDEEDLLSGGAIVN